MVGGVDEKAEQAGAPQGEMPGETGRKTLKLAQPGDREVFRFEGQKGKKKVETTFFSAGSKECLGSLKPKRAIRP